MRRVRFSPPSFLIISHRRSQTCTSGWWQHQSGRPCTCPASSWSSRGGSPCAAAGKIRARGQGAQSSAESKQKNKPSVALAEARCSLRTPHSLAPHGAQRLLRLEAPAVLAKRAHVRVVPRPLLAQPLVGLDALERLGRRRALLRGRRAQAASWHAGPTCCCRQRWLGRLPCEERRGRAPLPHTTRTAHSMARPQPCSWCAHVQAPGPARTRHAHPPTLPSEPGFGAAPFCSCAGDVGAAPASSGALGPAAAPPCSLPSALPFFFPFFLPSLASPSSSPVAAGAAGATPKPSPPASPSLPPFPFFFLGLLLLAGPLPSAPAPAAAGSSAPPPFFFFCFGSAGCCTPSAAPCAPSPPPSSAPAARLPFLRFFSFCASAGSAPPPGTARAWHEQQRVSRR